MAPLEGGVYNLLRSSDRTELYPGERGDIIDFSQPGHERQLLEGWYALEGVFGNKFRWIGARARARLDRVKPGAQELRIRGHAHEMGFEQAGRTRIELSANGARLGRWTLDRPGLFVLHVPLPDAANYEIEVRASPLWRPAGDSRDLSVNFSLLRLVVREDG
jgi:hypothetical protein